MNESDPKVNVREVAIPNPSGMHLRPAATFVQAANRHKGCEVFVSLDGQRVNGKSIMGLVMLAAPQGSVLTLECAGDGADEAVRELAQLVEEGFGLDG